MLWLYITYTDFVFSYPNLSWKDVYNPKFLHADNNDTDKVGAAVNTIPRLFSIKD